MAGQVQFEMKLSGVDGVIDMLKALPAEVVSKRGGPAKRALLKGAKVILAQSKINLQQSIARAGPQPDESTGLLLKSLVATRGKQPSSGNGERYLVRVKRQAYDGQKLGKRDKPGKRVTTLQTANLLEYGSEHQPATPWQRPAAAAKAAEAINTVTTTLAADVERVAAKLAKQRGA